MRAMLNLPSVRYYFKLHKERKLTRNETSKAIKYFERETSEVQGLVMQYIAMQEFGTDMLL